MKNKVRRTREKSKRRNKLHSSLSTLHTKKERVRRRRTCSLHHVKSYKELTEDALALSAEEGRGTLRKALGSCERAPIQGCPNGETRQSEPLSLVHEPIVCEREPGELKHLSTLRKREYSQSSGERNGRSPNRPEESGRGCRVRQKVEKA